MARLGVVVLLSLLSACDETPAAGGVRPAPPASAAPVEDPHADHDCSVAHPAEARRALPTATALNSETRARVTTLRISAHVGSVTLKKGSQDWTVAGPRGCVLPTASVERALDSLSALTLEPSAERAGEFELQLGVLIGEERVLHFDVADRKDGKDLVVLADSRAFRVTGLDRELLSADPRVWCARR